MAVQNKRMIVRMPQEWFDTIDKNQDKILPGKKSTRGNPAKISNIVREALQEFCARKGIWLSDA